MATVNKVFLIALVLMSLGFSVAGNGEVITPKSKADVATSNISE